MLSWQHCVALSIVTEETLEKVMFQFGNLSKTLEHLKF